MILPVKKGSKYLKIDFPSYEVSKDLSKANHKMLFYG